MFVTPDLEGALVAKKALCWQQCFFFTHAVLHIYYKPGLKHAARGQHVARDAFWEFSND